MCVSTTPTSREITITMISGTELLLKIQFTSTDFKFRTANSVISTASTTHTVVRAMSARLRLGLGEAPEEGRAEADISARL